MRTGLLVAGAAFGLGLGHGWLTETFEEATNAALTEDARMAIDVRCKGQSDRAGRECRTLLKKLYLAGSLDPDRTLRSYCDSVKTGLWGGRRPAPPKVCVERYGGWRQG